MGALSLDAGGEQRDLDKPIAPILRVLVRYPDTRREPEAFLCIDKDADPREVPSLLSRRRSVEITYREARAHLGGEMRRRWSDPAIFRTAPLLLRLYSAVPLCVHQNTERPALSPRRAAWCSKPAVTLGDAPARSRQRLWFELVVTSAAKTDTTRPLPPAARRLIETACCAC